MHRWDNHVWWGGHNAAEVAARTEPTAPHVETVQFAHSYINGHVPVEHAKGVADPSPYQQAVVDKLPEVYAAADAACKEAAKAAVKKASEAKKAKAAATTTVGAEAAESQAGGPAAPPEAVTEVPDEDLDDDFDLEDPDEDYADELDLAELDLSATLAASLDEIGLDDIEGEIAAAKELAEKFAEEEEASDAAAVDAADDADSFFPAQAMATSLKTCIDEAGKEAGSKCVSIAYRSRLGWPMLSPVHVCHRCLGLGSDGTSTFFERHFWALMLYRGDAGGAVVEGAGSTRRFGGLLELHGGKGPKQQLEALINHLRSVVWPQVRPRSHFDRGAVISLQFDLQCSHFCIIIIANYAALIVRGVRAGESDGYTPRGVDILI